MAWNKEILLYTVVWTGAVLYSVYTFAVESRYLFGYVDDVYGDFKPGWNFLQRQKDVADFEWESFLYLLYRISPWVILQLILTEVCLFTHRSEISRYIRTALSVLFISYELGCIPLSIILVQPCLFMSVGFFQSRLALWLTNGLCLLSFSLCKEVSKNEEYLKALNITEKQAYMIITAVCWTNLRCMSYCLDDLAKKPKTISDNEKYIDFLEYCIYLPTLIFGPYISYSDFRKNKERIDSSWTTRSRYFVQDICRCLFWCLFLEFVLHFIYVNATSFQPQIVVSLGSWALYGYGYTMGQAFHIKYVVMYGLSTKVAKYEGARVPDLPKCIGRIHLYSDMWKYFDPGLHKFLVRYIYIPTMISKKITNKIFSSFLCFAFVYVWHGLEGYILIWAALNFLGVSIETLSVTFFNKHIKESPATVCDNNDVWLRRFKCLVASPLLMMSAASNFYFFAGTNIGDIFIMRTLNGELSVILILLLTLYCCCQVSTELKTNERDKRK